MLIASLAKVFFPLNELGGGRRRGAYFHNAEGLQSTSQTPPLLTNNKSKYFVFWHIMQFINVRSSANDLLSSHVGAGVERHL